MTQEPHDPHDMQRHVSAAMSQGSPVTKVDIPVQMLRGPYALDNLADIGLAAEIQLLFAEHARAQSPYDLTPAGLLQALRARGVRSGNGRSLIGRDAVYETFARLRAKGFIQRIQTADPETKQRTGIRYVFHELPAWNPDAPPVATDDLPNLPFSQVGATSGIAGYGVPGSSNPANGANDASSQVGATSGTAGYGVPGSQASSQVGATSGPAGTPPHPPEEEVGTTSPSIPKHAATPRRGKTSSNDDTLDPAQRDKAIKFLMNLPGAWAVGLTRARGLADKLIANADATGWDLDTTLRLYLTRHEPDKGAVKNHGATLAYRISDMQSKDAVLAAAAEASEPAGQAAGAAPSKPGHVDWCGECDSPTYRFLVPDDGPAAKCKTCHPAYAATRA